jgi:hypothetical protein
MAAGCSSMPAAVVNRVTPQRPHVRRPLPIAPPMPPKGLPPEAVAEMVCGESAGTLVAEVAGWPVPGAVI